MIVVRQAESIVFEIRAYPNTAFFGSFASVKYSDSMCTEYDEPSVRTRQGVSIETIVSLIPNRLIIPSVHMIPMMESEDGTITALSDLYDR